jgi:hypothetical protein
VIDEENLPRLVDHQCTHTEREAARESPVRVEGAPHRGFNGLVHALPLTSTAAVDDNVRECRTRHHRMAGLSRWVLSSRPLCVISVATSS